MRIRLTSVFVEHGVDFTMPPTDAGTSIVAVFDDTCGNLVQIVLTTQPDDTP